MNPPNSEAELTRLQLDMERSVKWAQTLWAASFALLANWVFALGHPLPKGTVATLTVTVTAAVLLSIQVLDRWRRLRLFRAALVPQPRLPAQIFSIHDSRRPWEGTRRPVVLATGYFDLLHAGHVTFLQSCKKSPSEILVVGVHSDSLAQVEKGLNRPVLELKHRITALRGIGVVDYVFEADCFYNDPPYLILEFVQPDFVVLSTETERTCKKNDQMTFLANNAAERKFDLRLVPVAEPFHHTTTIIDRILSTHGGVDPWRANDQHSPESDDSSAG